MAPELQPLPGAGLPPAAALRGRCRVLPEQVGALAAWGGSAKLAGGLSWLREGKLQSQRVFSKVSPSGTLLWNSWARAVQREGDEGDLRPTSPVPP